MLGLNLNDTSYLQDKKIKTLFEEVSLLKGQMRKEAITPQTARFSNDVMILIALYSGMLDGIETNRQKAKAIKIKFGTAGIENIRKKLSNIESLKTIKNLKIVFGYFEKSNDHIYASEVLKVLEQKKNKLKKVATPK